ncbi:MAG: ABC transporter substrate-binding protein [Campylobacterales bacterium]|nr:ABC transporter substrate-binding protein [Campylobacterales bacterium]
MKFLITICLMGFASANGLEKRTLQLSWKHQFQFAGFYIAKEKGFYKDLGIDLDIKEFENGIDVVKEVVDQKAHFGISSSNLILEKSKGVPINLLGALYQSSPHVLVSLKSSGIKSIKDFKNKKIMISNHELDSASFISMLSSQGVSLDDMIKIKPTFKLQDLIDKKVDVISAYRSNQLYFLDKLAIEYNVWDPKDYGFEFYDGIGFTSTKLLETNPQSVINFKKATKKGWLYAFDNIDETVDLIYNKYNTQNKTKEALQYEANVLKKLALVNSSKFGAIDSNKIQRILDIYKILGLTKFNIDMEEFLFNQYNSHLQLTKKEKEFLSSNKKITMCNNPDWAPFEFINAQSGQIAGISIDTLQLISSKLNVDFEPVSTNSWKQSQEFLQEKKCDILPMAIKTQNRERYASFTKPYMSYKLAIITNKQKPFLNGIDEIVKKNYTISRKKGSGLISVLQQRYPNINIVQTQDYLEAFEKVSKGEVDCTITTLPVLSYYVNHFAINNLQIAGYTGLEYEISMAVRDDKPILRNILQKALDDITPQERQNIYNSWVSVRISESFDYTYILYIVMAVGLILVGVVLKQYFLKKQNQLLEKIVNEKTLQLQQYTKELEQLNITLEKRIKEEVEQNRQNELKIMEQAKMASMGEMIGNIAHQWRQPLSAITTSVSGMQLAKMMGGLNDVEFNKTCETIKKSALYLSDTINTFRDFIKAEKEKEHINLYDKLQQIYQIITPTLNSEHILLYNDIETSKELQMYLSMGELDQVIINIINNAKDVLKEKNNPNPWIKLSVQVKDDAIIIAIEDNGGGVPEEIISRIFEPYFTTKHKSQGTGLGLHMSYKIIHDSLGGKLYVNNTINGARFTIELPKNILGAPPSPLS